MAINTKSLVGEVFGERATHIGKGIFGGLTRGLTPAGGLRNIDPGDCGRDHIEQEMIVDRIGTAGLGLGDVGLFVDLPEAGLDFPPRRIVLDDLGRQEREVRGHQGHPLGLEADPHHAHLAPQGLVHHHPLGRQYLKWDAVDVRGIRYAPERAPPLPRRPRHRACDLRRIALQMAEGGWKLASGYQRRRLVENMVHRLGQLGDRLFSRTFERHLTKAHVWAAIINRFTYLGMLDPYRAGQMAPAAGIRVGAGNRHAEKWTADAGFI